MTRKERRAVIEGGGIALTGIGLVFTIPALLNAHDSVALLAAGLLGLAWFCWIAFFIYRTTTGEIR